MTDRSLLFCEDQAPIRKLVQAALGSRYTLHFAENGALGLVLARSVRPAAIFTDLSMPVMDGIAFAHAIRIDPDLRGTPIIFITASAQAADIRRFPEYGASDYLLKPFGAVDLRQAVERALMTTV